MKCMKKYLGVSILGLGVVISFYGALFIPHTHFEVEFSFNLLMLGSFPINMGFILDKVSLFYLIMVFLVSGMVFWYSCDYMPSSQFNYFMVILFMFMSSMVFLSSSSSLFCSILGWDMLGLTSVFLVIFYGSWGSFSSGVVTFMVNRIGDMFLMLSMTIIVGVDLEDSVLIGVLLLVSVLTKSAQIPFSSWLPLAMAAPTPVSSLVHSSTLVTAGVYLMVRFSWLVSHEINQVMFCLSSMSLVYSGVLSILAEDLKKLIAYSTLSHISFILISVSQGLITVGLFHLMVHAFFKSMMFMISGWVIHGHSDSQDIRALGLKWDESPILVSLFNIALISMMGTPFLSGFCSKEMVASSTLFMSSPAPYSCMISVGAFLCAAYSSRLALMMNKFPHLSSTGGHMSLSFSSFYPLYLGGLLCSFFGWWFLTLVEGELEESLLSYHDLLIKSSMIVSFMVGIGWGVVIFTYKLNPSMNPFFDLLMKLVSIMIGGLNNFISLYDVVGLAGSNLMSKEFWLSWSKLSSKSMTLSSIYSMMKIWMVLLLIISILSI
nr:NADH dehydrogenase subunit 5 [Linognathus africanus]